MKLRVFTLRLDAESGSFDDTEVVAFLAETEALAVSEHFFVFDGLPSLALVVQYRVLSTQNRSGGGRSGVRRGPPIEVPPESRELFEILRRWRNDRARRDGRPAYVLFTNAQLAAIANTRPSSRQALQAIEGIGDARVRDFADEVLELVRTAQAVEEGAGDDASP